MKIKTSLTMLFAALAGTAALVAQTSQVRSNDARTLELLRRTLQEQKNKPGQIIRTLEALPADPGPAPIRAATNQPPKVAAPVQPKPSPAKVAVTPPASPAPPPAKASTAIPAPPVQTNSNQQKLSEYEARLDEMTRQKAAREQAAQAQASALTNTPAGRPLTKRERLDALLRQVIAGRLSDADYKEQRAKIALEPD